jgi:predicted nuclease with TOPRIM domain
MFKFYIGIFMAMFIGGSVTFGIYYYNTTQKKIETLTIQNSQLSTAVDRNEQTINTLTSDIETIRQERNLLDQQFRRAQEQVQNLEDKLSEHDLEFLASQKPELVENIINNSTNDANRCFEILSGSPLTLEEIDAAKPSEINTSCPTIANPNYTTN